MSALLPATALTPAELRLVFASATQSFVDALVRWAEDAKTGRSDEELAQRLRAELGHYGGQSCGGAEHLTVEYQGEGLRIWASRDGFARHRQRPVLEGKATIRMARQVYGIGDPGNRQLSLF